MFVHRSALIPHNGSLSKNYFYLQNSCLFLIIKYIYVNIDEYDKNN